MKVKMLNVRSLDYAKYFISRTCRGGRQTVGRDGGREFHPVVVCKKKLVWNLFMDKFTSSKLQTM